MLGLTDHQLAIVMEAAKPLPLEKQCRASMIT
jgi:hypothetical protein